LDGHSHFLSKLRLAQGNRALEILSGALLRDVSVYDVHAASFSSRFQDMKNPVVFTALSGLSSRQVLRRPKSLTIVSKVKFSSPPSTLADVGLADPYRLGLGFLAHLVGLPGESWISRDRSSFTWAINSSFFWKMQFFF